MKGSETRCKAGSRQRSLDGGHGAGAGSATQLAVAVRGSWRWWRARAGDGEQGRWRRWRRTNPITKRQAATPRAPAFDRNSRTAVKGGDKMTKGRERQWPQQLPSANEMQRKEQDAALWNRGGRRRKAVGHSPWLRLAVRRASCGEAVSG